MPVERDEPKHDPLGNPSTEPITTARPSERRRMRIVVVAGPDRGAELLLDGRERRVGKSAACDLVLTDPTVSNVHLGVAHAEGTVVVRDLGSRNGSTYAGARFESIELGRGGTIAIGRSELRIEIVDPTREVPPSTATRLEGLVGRSDAMRRLFTLIERVAPANATVLIEGETGTGKELVAQALHRRSRRATGPFVICDLAALPASLAESELFGHVRGAFTGADRDRAGAFETAHGGTIFLDEIGELPIDLQPLLLRILERREVRRVGGNDVRAIDVRVIAATNRDLETEVHAGRFRADLYHRLATVALTVPPLRDRPEDVSLLASHFLAEPLRPETIRALEAHDWPGNVRELRNVLERATALAGPDGPAWDDVLGFARPARPRGGVAIAVDPAVPFRESKERLVDAWEREYLTALLASCGGNVSAAARRGGMDRAYLHKLLEKHDLRRR